MKFQIQETEQYKKLSSNVYNYIYNKELNTIVRWGENKSQNATYSPFGPEYAFIEFSGDMSELRLTLEILCSTKTLAVIIVSNCTEENQQHINKMALDYGVNVVYLTHSQADKTEGALFSLYVDKEGMCFPAKAKEGQEGIDIFKVGNLITDVWFSKSFKLYRWSKLEEVANGLRILPN
jgi:hypothetical protein